MGGIYKLLGLTVDCLTEQAQAPQRLMMAGTDIIYATGPGVAWTYMWDNHDTLNPEHVVGGPWHVQCLLVLLQQ